MMGTQKLNALYVFGGEKAQGAEIVITRLMDYNYPVVSAHLILSPGKYADKLIASSKPYPVTLCGNLRKLNRSGTGKLTFYLKAFRNYFAVSYFVYKYIKANQIDIVHANTIVPASYLVPLIIYAHVFKRKLRWYWSDHDLKYFSPIDVASARLCAGIYHYTLAVSQAVKNKYERGNKVKVLYNGLSLDTFRNNDGARQAFRKTLAISSDTIVLGIAASINPDKGQLDLVNVFNKLSARTDNILLVIAGGYAAATPQYSADVDAAIKLNPKIIYLGHISAMDSFYNGCDVIINNSNNYRSESLGTTIYEAMACEKVVVASNTGGTPEIITDGVDGFLFDADSPAQLAVKLSYVISNYVWMDSVRQAARGKVTAKFNIETMARNYNDIIQNNS